jgi:hypothetical protein
MTMGKPMRRWQSHTLFLRPANAQAGHEAALAAWAHWCAAHAGSACELALSSHWVIPCAGDAEQALPRWEHYMELSAATIEQDWILRSSLAPVLSCIASRALVDGLRHIADEHSVRLRWVGPWWAWHVRGWWGSLRAQTPGSAATLQAQEPGIGTWLTAVLDAKGKAVLEQVWTQASDAVEAVPATMPDVPGTTRVEAGVPADLLLVEWTRPETSTWKAPWAEVLDFVGPRVRTALWSWGLLVLGTAACMAVAERAQVLVATQDETQASLRRLERAQHQKTIALAAPRAASSASTPPTAKNTLDEATLKQAARVSQLLAYPWPAVIGRMEQAAQAEHAVLTGFSLDINGLGGRPGALAQARLQAALSDDASALRWVAAHGDGAQLLGRDTLATPFDTALGRYVLRAEATWQAGAEALP